MTDGVAFCAAGESHGIRNVGDGPASYIVLEFHAGSLLPALPLLRRRVIAAVPMRVRAIVPERVRRVAKRIVGLPPEWKTRSPLAR